MGCEVWGQHLLAPKSPEPITMRFETSGSEQQPDNMLASWESTALWPMLVLAKTSCVPVCTMPHRSTAVEKQPMFEMTT